MKVVPTWKKFEKRCSRRNTAFALNGLHHVEFPLGSEGLPYLPQCWTNWAVGVLLNDTVSKLCFLKSDEFISILFPPTPPPLIKDACQSQSTMTRIYFMYLSFSYYILRSLRPGRSGDRIPVWGEIFRTRPHRSWGPPSLLYNGYRVFTGGKAVRSWRWPPTPSSRRLKKE